MRLSQKQLDQLIREEIQRVLQLTELGPLSATTAPKSASPTKMTNEKLDWKAASLGPAYLSFLGTKKLAKALTGDKEAITNVAGDVSGIPGKVAKVAADKFDKTRKKAQKHDEKPQITGKDLTPKQRSKIAKKHLEDVPLASHQDKGESIEGDREAVHRVMQAKYQPKRKKPVAPVKPATQPTQSTEPLNYTPAEQTQTMDRTNEGRGQMRITKKRIQEIIQEELIAEASFLDKIYDATATPDVPEYKEGPANKLKGMITQSKYKEKTQDLKDTADAAEGIATLATLPAAAVGGAAKGAVQGIKHLAKAKAIDVAKDAPVYYTAVKKAKKGDKLGALGKEVATTLAGTAGTTYAAATDAIDAYSKKPAKPAAPAKPTPPTKTTSATQPAQSTEPLNYTPAEQTQTMSRTNEGERHMKMTNSQLAQIIREEIGNVLKEVGQLSGQSQEQTQLRAPNTPNEDSKNAQELTNEENLDEDSKSWLTNLTKPSPEKIKPLSKPEKKAEEADAARRGLTPGKRDDDPLNESQFVDIIRKEIASLFGKAK